MKKEEIFKELTKLPALLRERVPPGAFDMRYTFSQQGRFGGNHAIACYRLSKDPECGTAACVYGWAQVFHRMRRLKFNPLDVWAISEHEDDWDLFEFITLGSWSEHPTEHTLEAACARIEYVVKHGCAPDGWDAQVYGHSPVTYREI